MCVSVGWDVRRWLRTVYRNFKLLLLMIIGLVDGRYDVVKFVGGRHVGREGVECVCLCVYW